MLAYVCMACAVRLGNYQCESANCDVRVCVSGSANIARALADCCILFNRKLYYMENVECARDERRVSAQRSGRILLPTLAHIVIGNLSSHNIWHVRVCVCSKICIVTIRTERANAINLQCARRPITIDSCEPAKMCNCHLMFVFRTPCRITYSRNG